VEHARSAGTDREQGETGNDLIRKVALGHADRDDETELAELRIVEGWLRVRRPRPRVIDGNPSSHAGTMDSGIDGLDFAGGEIHGVTEPPTTRSTKDALIHGFPATTEHGERAGAIERPEIRAREPRQRDSTNGRTATTTNPCENHETPPIEKRRETSSQQASERPDAQGELSKDETHGRPLILGFELRPRWNSAAEPMEMPRQLDRAHELRAALRVIGIVGKHGKHGRERFKAFEVELFALRELALGEPAARRASIVRVSDDLNH
jgi:hypothetical protein